MQDLTRSQKARFAISTFKTLAKANALRGFFRPSGRMGGQLADCLLTLNPEIYGSMTDPRVVELNGLEYVIDRLPRGVEECTRITLTEEDQFGESVFEEIVPLRRRRTCCRISETEMCFVVTRGLSEIYDILTHLTFLNIESGKIESRMMRESGGMTNEWRDLKTFVEDPKTVSEHELEQAIWNLSLIVGRPYSETRQTYERLEKSRAAANTNSGLFSIIYHLGNRVHEERKAQENMLVVSFTPSLMNIIAHQRNGERWARSIKTRLRELGLHDRPLHIISANLHSAVNLLYGFAAARACAIQTEADEDLYNFIGCIRENADDVFNYARQNGLHEIKDQSGSHIDCQLIDTACLDSVPQHPTHRFDFSDPDKKKAPVLLVMDYAFGAQAFEVMDCLLDPDTDEPPRRLNVKSISIMGKAGVLAGKKGDIMLATAHVIEGTSDNYTCKNDLKKSDFEPGIDVYSGPMITVLGTSLQNRDLLQRFQESWQTIGLEMEGGHYQRAISAAILKGHIPRSVKTRYAYYASDNPLVSGQTLAAGEMGVEGIRPTYMVTRVILEKIVGK